MTTHHDKHNQPFHRSRLPLVPEESAMHVIEPQNGLYQMLVDGELKIISERTALKIRDDFIKHCGDKKL